MHFRANRSSNLSLPAGWATSILRAGLVSCLLGLLGAQASYGAGCQQSADRSNLFEGGQAGRLPRCGWWTKGPLVRIYEAGKFRYFQVPTGKAPCHGPSCRGSAPEHTFTLPATNESNRVNLLCDQVSGRELFVPAPGRRHATETFIPPTSPVLAGPLRPPRT